MVWCSLEAGEGLSREVRAVVGRIVTDIASTHFPFIVREPLNFPQPFRSTSTSQHPSFLQPVRPPAAPPSLVPYLSSPPLFHPAPRPVLFRPLITANSHHCIAAVRDQTYISLAVGGACSTKLNLCRRIPLHIFVYSPSRSPRLASPRPHHPPLASYPYNLPPIARSRRLTSLQAMPIPPPLRTQSPRSPLSLTLQPYNVNAAY